jgi:predicted nucleic acid-binding Zn ribbon protein
MNDIGNEISRTKKRKRKKKGILIMYNIYIYI